MDVRLTYGYAEMLSEGGIELKGHVVLDHDKYSYIDPSKASELPAWRSMTERSKVYTDIESQSISQHEYNKKQPQLFSEREVVGSGGCT